MSNTSIPIIDNNDWRESSAFALMSPTKAYSARYTFEQYATRALVRASAAEKAVVEACAIVASTTEDTAFVVARIQLNEAIAKAEVAQKDVREINATINLHIKLMGY
jgi:hypothetical protein